MLCWSSKILSLSTTQKLTHAHIPTYTRIHTLVWKHDHGFLLFFFQMQHFVILNLTVSMISKRLWGTDCCVNDSYCRWDPNGAGMSWALERLPLNTSSFMCKSRNRPLKNWGIPTYWYSSDTCWHS